MNFSTEITIMGRDSGSYLRDPLRRGFQSLSNGDTIYMNDAKHMVIAVIAQADGGMIHQLNIRDHGNNEACMFGKDMITVDNFEKFAPFFAKLQPFFTKDAKVFLQHCDMGQNEGLMFLFAATFRAKVYAGTEFNVGAPFNFNWGDYIGCTPAGTIFKEMHRP
jgi:hypothetical protein